MASKILLSILVSLSFAKKIPMPKQNPKVPDAIMKAVKKKHPDFKLLSHLSFSAAVMKIASHHPAKVLGDFNNDKKQDAGLYGYSQKERKFFILAIVSSGKKKKYKVFKINEEPFQPKQEVSGFGNYLNMGYKGSNKYLKRDVLQWESVGEGPASVTAYYYSRKSKKMKILEDSMD